MRKPPFFPILVLLMAAVAHPCQAADMPWASFLRPRPSFAGPALQEVQRGDPYELVACADGWCQVTIRGTTGFIPQAALTAPPALRPDSGRGSQPTDCIGFRRSDRTPELLCRDAARD